MDYTILELAETAKQGSLLFRDFPDVRFASDMSQGQIQFDVVLFCSALQYFDNYIEMIEQATRYQAKTIILTDTLMGAAKTFVCAQVNMPDRVIPMMVFNVKDIVGIFSGYEYDLQLKTISHFPFHTFSNYEGEAATTRYYNLIFSNRNVRT